jgi:hypothetical protein
VRFWSASLLSCCGGAYHTAERLAESINHMTLLQAAYLIDAVVTTPLVIALLTRNRVWTATLLGQSVPADPSFRIMVGAIWAALMTCATLGVLFPNAMAPVLLVQLIYKGLWLAVFAVPRWMRGRSDEVSWKIAALFGTYVGIYPWIIPWTELFLRH